ncbi:MAG: transposase [Betaproteobacteria bacterium]
MPRQARLVVPGVALHVIQRGNNRQTCFRSDSDFLLYLLHLRVLASKHDCAIHAYCLMKNHVHLLVTPSAEHALALLMRDLGQRYVQYFNRTYGRTGTLWEGRYRSCITESANYVLACYRYIELNPVRAGLADAPDRYLWSSYRANSGSGEDRLLTEHPEYVGLGSDLASRQNAYRGLFEATIEPNVLTCIREATNGGYPLAGEAFKSQIKLGRGQKLAPGRPGRPINKPLSSDRRSP